MDLKIENEDPYYHLYLVSILAAKQKDYQLAIWCLSILEKDKALKNTNFWNEPAFFKLRKYKAYKELVKLYHNF